MKQKVVLVLLFSLVSVFAAMADESWQCRNNESQSTCALSNTMQQQQNYNNQTYSQQQMQMTRTAYQAPISPVVYQPAYTYINNPVQNNMQTWQPAALPDMNNFEQQRLATARVNQSDVFRTFSPTPDFSTTRDYSASSLKDDSDKIKEAARYK